MLAFTNTLVTKDQILAQLRAHAEADEIVKGKYWEDGKGCAVGCTIHSDDHMQYEDRFGVPVMLAQLEECIFEGLPNGEAKAWPIRFMSAIKPGTDLSRVGWQFLHWLLTDKIINPGIEHPLVRDAIKQCADVLMPLTKGLPITENAWSAGSAARSAAWRVAGAARIVVAGAAESAESAAWSVESVECAAVAARTAAESVAGAAWSVAGAAVAARTAAESVAGAAESAESAAWINMSDKLVELIHAGGEAA